MKSVKINIKDKISLATWMMILIKNAVFLNPLKKKMYLKNSKKLKKLKIILIEVKLIGTTEIIESISIIIKIKQLKIIRVSI